MHRLPTYQKIVYSIRKRITTGEWPRGSKIPTQRDLSHKFKVNRSTIVTAIGILKAEGLLEGKMGSGVYVTSDTDLVRSPNWADMSKWAFYDSNDPLVQLINHVIVRKDLIQLGKAELGADIAPQEEIIAAIRKMSGNLREFGSVDQLGDGELREVLSNHLRGYGISTSPANILIVSGALQGLRLLSVGLLGRGSTVFMESPSYLQFIHFFQRSGMKTEYIPIEADGLDVAELAHHRIVHGQAILSINPTFQNPTNTVMSLHKRKSLLKINEYLQMPIIEDDVFRDLWIDQPAPSPLKSLDTSGQVIYVGSLSKTIAVGLRLGWIVGPKKVIERLADIKMQIDYGSSLFSQAIAKELLSTPLYNNYLNRLRPMLRYKRNVLLSLLTKYLSKYASWNKPQGGYFIYVIFKCPLNMREFFKMCLKLGVVIVPGFLYHDERPSIRISYAYPTIEAMKKGVAILQRVVERMSKMRTTPELQPKKS